MKKNRPKLTQGMVDRYVEYCNVEKTAKASREKLRLTIIDAIEAGSMMPEKGPFILDLTYQHRPQIDWQKECLKLARLLEGSKAGAKARMQQIEKRGYRNPLKVPKLDIKPNPLW